MVAGLTLAKTVRQKDEIRMPGLAFAGSPLTISEANLLLSASVRVVETPCFRACPTTAIRPSSQRQDKQTFQKMRFVTSILRGSVSFLLSKSHFSEMSEQSIVGLSTKSKKTGHLKNFASCVTAGLFWYNTVIAFKSV